VGESGRAEWRFDGWIAGTGTASGHRFVVGRWFDSPLGSFADVMWETPEGRRVLLAPSAPVADLVAATYAYDEVRLVAVHGSGTGGELRVGAGPVDLRLTLGRRDLLGHLLAAVPARVSGSTRWAGAIDPVARCVLPGVRTAGTGPGGRRQWYLARDHRPVVGVEARVDGIGCGPVAPVDPPVRFGFSSVPRSPAWVRCTAVIRP
jgi:hypothetical protein